MNNNPPPIKQHRRFILRLGIGFALVFGGLCVFLFWGNGMILAFENDLPSKSVGTTANGKLINGKRLPTSGPNFIAYSYIGVALGRNTLHGKVGDTVLSAYNRLNKTQPNLRFVYGECGNPNGGPFKPHRTHQNGLSVDFFVPVKDQSGTKTLCTNITNKFGYAIHFDAQGYCKEQDCHIDFEALAAHLLALHEAAGDQNLRIERVILALELQPLLFATTNGGRLKNLLTFSTRPAWVRHDKHYHVDFHNPDK